MKVTHQLGLAGWIETVRGNRGGMRLALAPEAIGLGAVVRSVEPDFRLVECLDGGGHCVLQGGCRLAGIFDDALQDFLARLDRHTLADILPSGAPHASSGIAFATLQKLS
jgi:Rrf2 family nitric oxide-sensitive transcriptional repressor